MDNKIKQNKAQYSLDRQTAFSLRIVGNYEFLTDEDIFSENNCYKKLLKSKDLNIHDCSGYHYCTTSYKSGSAQVQILLAVCRRFSRLRIFPDSPSWK